MRLRSNSLPAVGCQATASTAPSTPRAGSKRDHEGVRALFRAEELREIVDTALEDALLGVKEALQQILQNQQLGLACIPEPGVNRSSSQDGARYTSCSNPEASFSTRRSAGSNTSSFDFTSPLQSETRPNQRIESVQILAERHAERLIGSETCMMSWRRYGHGRAESQSHSPPPEPRERQRAESADVDSSPPSRMGSKSLALSRPGRLAPSLSKDLSSPGGSKEDLTLTSPSSKKSKDGLHVNAITLDLTSVREEQEKALTSAYSHPAPSTPSLAAETVAIGRGSLPAMLCWTLYIYGMVPGNSYRTWCCRKFVVLAIVLACTGWLAFEGACQLRYPDEVTMYVNTSDVLCGFGAAIGLLSLRWDGLRFLLTGHGQSPLEGYATCRGFLELWRRRSARVSWAVFLTWLLDCMVRVGISMHCEGDFNYMAAGMSVFASSLFACLVYLVLHICEVLTIMVDDFCTQFFATPNCRRGMSEWNTLQAVLRQAGKSIDICCSVLPTSAIAAALFDGANFILEGHTQEDMKSRFLLKLAPDIMKVCLALFGFHRAAMVTEKCQQAPSLINSIMMPGAAAQIDPGLQYLVQYMEHSAAGFYIKGVRINSFMVIKVSYAMASALLLLALKFNNT